MTPYWDPPEDPELLDFGNGFLNSPGRCWVCGMRGTDEKLDSHHMVPRALGGGEGPMVCLCQPCHRKTHELGKGADDVEGWPPSHPVARKRLEILAEVVKKAASMTDKDPNKSLVFMDRFPANTAKMLKMLAKGTGMSQKNVVRAAIGALFARQFGTSIENADKRRGGRGSAVL